MVIVGKPSCPLSAIQGRVSAKPIETEIYHLFKDFRVKIIQIPLRISVRTSMQVKAGVQRKKHVQVVGQGFRHRVDAPATHAFRGPL